MFKDRPNKLVKPAKVPSWSKGMKLDVYVKSLQVWMEMNKDVSEAERFQDVIESLKTNKEIERVLRNNNIIIFLYFKNIYYRLDVVVLLPPLCRIGLDLLAAAPAPVVHRSIHVRVVPTRIIPVPVWQITAIGRMVATIVHNRGSMTRHALSPYCLFELPSGSFGVSRRMISRCASRLRSKTNK